MVVTDRHIARSTEYRSAPAGAPSSIAEEQDQPRQTYGQEKTVASSVLDRQKLNVLLGISGSVAAIKAEALAAELRAFCNLKIVATDASLHFLSADFTSDDRLHDSDDWREWRTVGDPIAHIELRRWADLLVVAPLSANTLAKMAQGMCDNLLTCVVRAWDVHKPLLVAPAMNTMMWESPFTQRHLHDLQATLGVRIIPTVVKKLACGDVGNGAMASVDEIVAVVKQELEGVSALQSV